MLHWYRRPLSIFHRYPPPAPCQRRLAALTGIFPGVYNVLSVFNHLMKKAEDYEKN